MRIALALATFIAVATASAQRPRLELALPDPAALARSGPSLRALDVVSDAETHGLLDSGFPTRLHFRVELWSAGTVFDALRDRVEWDVFLYFDALAKRYRVVRVEGGGDDITSAGQFGSFGELVSEVEQATLVPLRARPIRDRQYYIAVLDVESLSLTDLDEVGRWLRGEMRPAVRGERNPGTALGRGLRRMFVRLLGAERRNLQARSRSFVVPP